MKHFLFILASVLLFAFTGCSSNEKKAQKLINQKLRLTLHDYSSYESVQFGKLDSTYSTVKDTPEYREALEKSEQLQKEAMMELTKIKMYQELFLYELAMEGALHCKMINDSSLHYYQICIKLKELFIPEFIGFNITHTFRTNNSSGNKVIAHYKYYFDKDITKIIKEEDISE